MYRKLWEDFYLYFGNAHSSKYKDHICIPCNDENILKKRRQRLAEGGEFLYLIRHMETIDEKFLMTVKVNLKEENFSDLSHPQVDKEPESEAINHNRSTSLQQLKEHSTNNIKPKEQRRSYVKESKAKTKSKVKPDKRLKPNIQKKFYAIKSKAKIERGNKHNEMGASRFQVSCGQVVYNHMTVVVTNVKHKVCEIVAEGSTHRKMRRIQSMSMLNESIS